MIDEDVREWMRAAGAGDVMLLVARTDGKGNAAWAHVHVTAALVADGDAWKLHVLDEALDALREIEARPQRPGGA